MNRKTAIRTLAAALLLALGAGAASAAPQGTPPAPARPSAAAPAPAPMPAWEALDANRDGIVTLPEIDVYSRPLAASVAHCDRDRDKAMSRDEYAACERHPTQGSALAHAPARHHRVAGKHALHAARDAGDKPH